MNKRFYIIVSYLLFAVYAMAQYVDYVNPFIGASTNTEAAGAYHGLGKTYPGATTPFGTVQVSPQTISGGDNGSGYSYEHRTIEGFSMTQMSGVGWFGDMGNFMVMPTTGPLKCIAGNEQDDIKGWRSHYDKKSEKAYPGYYSVRLDDYAINVEASATTRCGILRFCYPENSHSRFQVDLSRRVGGRSTEQYLRILDDNTFEGWMKCPPEGGGWGHGEGHVDYTVYFYARSSKPLSDYGFWEGDRVIRGKREMRGERLGFFGEFPTSKGEQVELKVAISFVDMDGARRNFESEIADKDFNQVCQNAKDVWNKSLSAIEVTGGSYDDRVIFYTSLYHTMLDPRIYQDVDGRYVGGDLGIHQNGDIFTKRTVFSGWDVFRSQMPLQTIINPALVNDVIQSLITMATQSGRRYYERWELLNAYSGCMLGNPALSVIADAWVKNIGNFDRQLAFEYAKNTSRIFGNDSLGYTPGSLSVSKTLEYAYGDWCVAQMAYALNKDVDYRLFSRKSLAYKNIWDENKHWFRPRNADGTWQEWPEEGRLKEWYGCMECNLLQQGWFIPHDVEGMVALMGGRERVLGDLQEMFEKTPQDMLWNMYYNHANEPVHLVPYLFNRLGKPHLTQYWTRYVCRNAYENKVDGLKGNEDVGQMSAWYVLSAAGLHQYCPGNTRFEITSPVFNTVKFNLPNGKTFTIVAHGNNEKNIYIQRASLNGQSYGQMSLDYQDVMNGGTLELQMGRVPVEEYTNVGKILLNSDVYEWQLKPQAEVADSGNTVATVGYKWKGGVKGVVPGTVFTAYVEAGKEDNPEYADNIYRVDETKYNRPFWYRTEFKIPTPIQEGQRVWLCFDNTNRFADFYFNGHKISGTPESRKDVSGHMLRSRFDVTELYHTDRPNAVAVLIYDPDQKKTRQEKGPYGVACSPSYLAAAGWDWMPYVPGRLAGITGNAYLEITGAALMQDPWVRSSLPSLDKAELTIVSDVKNTATSDQDVTLSGVIVPVDSNSCPAVTPIHFSKTLRIGAGQTKTISIDKHDVEQMVVAHPKLWWPNGYGDPNLYECRLQCTINGTVTDVKTINFGIRKYDYRIEKNSVGYPVLQLYVNNQRIFVKGGNWGMSEYLLRCHGDQYEPKVRLHKDMNYNMIRLWTGCVTDDEFYDYCDKMGLMVWNDFWLYVAFNDVVQHDAFKENARDKVRRLRNHPSIAVWCGANETHPVDDIDQALRRIVMEEDGNDRLYTSCSNQDAKSGSGWWKDLPPRHHFETSASNLAFNNPGYPYGIDHGYGFRSEIGMPTFPQYESLKLFIPEHQQWPLPSDEELKNDSANVYNLHFFGKEASNADPVSYKHAVDERYGTSQGIEEFCEKAQLINLEDMKGMYEAWNDKMWEDASALIIWMSHPAYPSFVWQTYDYYYDPTGCYWGAKKACEPRHIQWNALTNSVKVINSTPQTLRATAVATVCNLNGEEVWHQQSDVCVAPGDKQEAFCLHLEGIKGLSPLHFIRLRLLSQDDSHVISDNCYWNNHKQYLDYQAFDSLQDVDVEASLIERTSQKIIVRLKNNSTTVAFALRMRLVDGRTGERILPLLMSGNYHTLMPGEETTFCIEPAMGTLDGNYRLLLKPYRQKERCVLKIDKR